MKKIALISKDKFEMLKELSDSEYKFITDEINFLINFDRKNSEIDKLFKTLENLMTDLYNADSKNLVRLLNEYYNIFKSFLDYWETSLKREFGKKSIQYQNFQIATNEEYSNSFEYRFSYELRNFIQHCGFPNINFRSYIDKKGNKATTLEIEVKEILEDFDWKKAVENDLLQKNKIDLKDTLLVHIDSLERIHNVAMNQYDLKNTMSSAIKILEYKNLLNDDRKLACINLPKNYPNKLDGKISILVFPFEIAEKFLKMIN